MVKSVVSMSLINAADVRRRVEQSGACFVQPVALSLHGRSQRTSTCAATGYVVAPGSGKPHRLKKEGALPELPCVAKLSLRGAVERDPVTCHGGSRERPDDGTAQPMCQTAVQASPKPRSGLASIADVAQVSAKIRLAVTRPSPHDGRLNRLS
jgi:hypothetical protein